MARKSPVSKGSGSGVKVEMVFADRQNSSGEKLLCNRLLSFILVLTGIPNEIS